MPHISPLLAHVALYLRISQDKNGRAEGVAAQDMWGREYAAALWPGVPIVVYRDNDLSAARDDVIRPAYEALRQAIRDGQVIHVWAVEQSRLERREVPWFQLAAELEAAGVSEVHTRRDGIIRLGDVVGGIKAVLNAFEVRRAKERLMDKLDVIAADGRPPGSKPGGYRHGVNEFGEKTYVIVPEQAEAIRWAAGRILAGWSLSSVAKKLRDQGMHGPHLVKVRNAAGHVLLKDGRWVDPKSSDEAAEEVKAKAVTRPSTITASSLRSMVTNPTVAGHRIHRGADVGKGNWEPILDEATWQAVRARLDAPRTVDRADGGTYPVGLAHTRGSAQRYVLTGGLAVCGRCGGRCGGQVLQAAKGKPYLICKKRRNTETGERGACVGIMLLETEAHVVDRLFAELDKPEFLDAIAEDTHAGRRSEIVNELAGLDAKRTELARMWGKPGGLTSAEWQAARAQIDVTEQQLRAELAAKPQPPARVSIEQAKSAWPDMTLDEQRHFIRLFIDRVTISPAKPGKKGFDSGRVVITWRTR